MSEILVGNIQRFSVHDGPGIRTTAFLMGCSICCPWCANPENLRRRPFYYDGSLYGSYYTAEELTGELMRDKAFFAGGGGVTFSGGEALLQTVALVPVWQALRDRGVHIAVETALFVDTELVRIASQYVDLFLVDVKTLERRRCREVFGGDSELYRRNLIYLAENARAIELRLPVVPGITATNENIAEIRDLLARLALKHIQIFPLHELARTKYEKLGQSFYEQEKASQSYLDRIKAEFSEHGISCEQLTI